MYNASNEQQIKKKEQKLKNERDQELEDIKTILNTSAGLRFFKRLIKDGYIFNTSMTGSSYTFFNEGARNLVLKYFADICESAPHKVAELLIKSQEEVFK